MMRPASSRRSLAAAAFVLLFAVHSEGQPLGVFRWQLHPFCNVLSVTVTQVGGVYRLEGFDDQCGASTAALVGMAIPKVDGTVTLGLTEVLSPQGTPVHIHVSLDLGTLSGPWTDSAGLSGTLIFNPGTATGTPRPMPTITIPDGFITTAKLAEGAVDSSRVQDGSLRAADVNTNEIQRRVSGSCAGGFVQAVNPDGTVACGTAGAGDITGVSVGTGLVGGGTAGDLTLAVDFAGTGAAGSAARSDHTHAAGGTDSTALGESALPVNTAARNTANGSQAMLLNTSGAFNTAAGARTLRTNTAGHWNTAVGADALFSNTTANGNTGLGALTLTFNTTGADNTAVGFGALNQNTTGIRNTAVGSTSMARNLTANDNTAIGHSALLSNTTGAYNTALGYAALVNNTTGELNTALGRYAGRFNTTGVHNTAVGVNALMSNTTAAHNTAVGGGTMLSNETGAANTAVGSGALHNNVSGQLNTAVGWEALFQAVGNGNIALGSQAGSRLIVGSENIYIGNYGASENTTIRIGSSQTSAYIAGITGQTSSSGVNVLVNASGKLGTTTSSARFKEEIASLGDAGDKISALRPVRFFYKPEYDDGSRLEQYGLIAEEVAQVAPELVILDAEGRPQTVRYHLLTPLLLAEVQRLQKERAALSERLDAQARDITELKTLLAAPQRERSPR